MKVDFNDLKGKTILKVTQSPSAPGKAERLQLHVKGGFYEMYHYQDCCESVYLEDVVGDIKDVLNSTVIDAYESENKDLVPDSSLAEISENVDSFTWTFYHISTSKGSVTLRWFGGSNGYYSEAVDFRFVSYNVN